MVMPFNSLLSCYEIQICLQLVAEIGAKGGRGKYMSRCVGVTVKSGSSLHHLREITGTLDDCKQSSPPGGNWLAWHISIELYN
jgi:hypothetical protein